jgi:predicted kinase
MNRPRQLSLILITGPAGAGKTTLADYLHDELSYTAHIGVDHIKRFISEFRDIPTHQEVSKKVIVAMTHAYLKDGISVIVEEGMSRSEVEEFATLAQKHDAAFFVYRLSLSKEISDDRAQKRQAALNKPPIAEEELAKHFMVHEENDYPDVVVLDAGNMTTEEMGKRVLVDLVTG